MQMMLITLFSCDAVALKKWLSLFVVEARKKDGSR